MNSEKTLTRDLIFHVFLDYYSRKPLQDIYVSDICKTADISRSTFYYYFDDVIDVCEKLEKTIIDDMEADLTQTMLSSQRRSRTTSDDRFIKAYSKCLEKYVENQTIFRLLLNGSHGVSFHKAWTESVTKKFAEPFCIIDDGGETFYLICRFFGGGLVTMLANWINNGCKEPPELIARTTDQIMYMGTVKALD